MKRTLLFYCFLGSIFYVNGQSYFGFRDDNYAGIQGALFNPASIVDSKYKADVTVFSVSATGQNDLYGVNFAEALGAGYDFETQGAKILKRITEEILM